MRIEMLSMATVHVLACGNKRVPTATPNWLELICAATTAIGPQSTTGCR